MARKVFISFLGYSYYIPCVYTREYIKDKNKKIFKSDEVNYIQIATMDYFQEIGRELDEERTWTKDDKAYIVLTEGAEKNNWNTNETLKHRDTGETSPGLCSCFGKKKEKGEYQFEVIPIKEIPDGNNEEQLFKIFDTVFNKVFKNIKDGEETELYFDVTHSFRSLPMLALVMANYVKFLRNVKVKSITYGNYEARKKVGTKEVVVNGECKTREVYEAPIIDLTPLSQIQDWTFAAADIIRNGNSNRLYELAKSSYLIQMLRTKNALNMSDRLMEKKIQDYVESLHEMLQNMRLCSLPKIMDYSIMDNVNKKYNDAKNQMSGVMYPIQPILEKVKETFKDFKENQDIQNGFFAAKWCCEHQLYQQAITILNENITTDFCKKIGLDESIYEQRNFAASYLRNEKNDYNTDELKKINTNSPNSAENFKNRYKNIEILSYKERYSHIAVWTHDKRNMFNHAAMTKVAKVKDGRLYYAREILTIHDINDLKDIVIPYVLNPLDGIREKAKEYLLDTTQKELRNEILKLIQSSK